MTETNLAQASDNTAYADLLRRHAAELAASNPPMFPGLPPQLWKMADILDGGVGPDAHHGCPDTNVPTAQCPECHLVLDAEVTENPRMFTSPSA